MSFICSYCDKDKTYSSRGNLHRHLKEIHYLNVNSDSVSHYFKCLEGCNMSFAFNADLRDHLSSNHGHLTEKEWLIFSNLEEFNSWLNNVENSSHSAYIKRTGAVQKDDSIKTYFDCNRSGQAKVLDETIRKRKMRSQGSRKIGSACTSQIIMTQMAEQVQVTFYKTHYGHSFDLQHLPLTKEERSTLASHLIQGVPMSKILDKYRENISQEPERVNLVTRKDLRNVRTSYNIDIPDGVCHKEDAISPIKAINQRNTKVQTVYIPSLDVVSNLSEPERPLAVKSNINEMAQQELELLSSKMSIIKDPQIFLYLYKALKNANNFVDSQQQEAIESFPNKEGRELPNKKIKNQLTVLLTKKSSNSH